MKRCIRYISALLAVLAFFACSDDDEPTFIPASFELISGEGTAIDIDPDGTTGTVKFSYEKDSVSIQVKTNQENWQYTFEQPAEHFTVVREGDKLTISVPENKTSLFYKGTLTLTTGIESNFARCVLSLSQSPAPDPEVTVEPGIVEFPYQGGETELTVTTTHERWTVRKMLDNYTDDFIIVSQVGDKVIVKTQENHTPLLLNGTVIVTCGEGDRIVEAEVSVTQQGAPPVSLSVDKTSIEFTSEVGTDTVAVTVENVEDWNFQCKETWLTVKREGNFLLLTAPANHSANTPTAEILVYAGNKDYKNYDERRITITQKSWENAGALVFELTIPEPQDGGVTALLPLIGLTNCTIDWGDGSELAHPTEKIPSHIYAAAGVYKVAVRGGVEKLYSQDFAFSYPYKEAPGYITAILSWGNTGLISMERGLYKCYNLKRIPDDTEGAFANVTTFSDAFNGCESLESIPAGLFTYAKSAQDFRGCFQYCNALREIPATLFIHCESAQKFYGTFSSCEELTSVPDGLFAGRSKVTTFTSVFGRNPNLETVGKDVFKGCTENTSFNQAFSSCEKLRSVPADIFDDCRKVTDFRFTFRYNTAMSGESPYTLVDGKKVHLYERNAYPDHFSAIPNYKSCFTDCTGLSDYNAIVEAGWN